MFSNDVILTSILVYCQRRFSQPTNHENVIDLLLVFFFVALCWQLCFVHIGGMRNGWDAIAILI